MGQRLYRVVAPNGNYTDQSGQQKTRWLNVGSIIETNSGRVVLKLDCLPVNPPPNDDGQPGIWLQCFEPDRNEGQPPQRQGQSRGQNTGQQYAEQSGGGFRQQAPQQQQYPPSQVPQQPPQGDQQFADDDIPF